MRTVVMLDQRFRALLTDRDNLVVDSRFFAAAKRKKTAFVHLYFVRRGEMELRGVPHHDTPAGFVFLDQEFDCINSATTKTFRSWGDRCTTLSIRIPAAVCAAPIGISRGGFALSPALRQVLDQLFAATSDRAVTKVMKLLFAQLAVDRIVTNDPNIFGPQEDPEEMVRLWSAIAPRYSAFAASTSIAQFRAMTGLSLRQLSRNLTAFVKRYGLYGDGYRDASRVLRLRGATLWLSAEGITTTDVAQLVGYSSLDAMNRALRDAKLPPPGEIRIALAADPLSSMTAQATPRLHRHRD